jgi:hypothetical protein
VVQKRERPSTTGATVCSVPIGTVSLISLVYFFFFTAAPRTDVVLVWAGLSLFGILFLPLGLWDLLSPGSAYNKFRRSSTTVQAKVVGYRREEREAALKVEPEDYMDGDYHTFYFVEVQFDAVRSGAAVEQVTLEADASEELWKRLRRPGTEVTVRYAREDPRVALLEGEKGFDSSSTVPPTP